MPKRLDSGGDFSPGSNDNKFLHSQQKNDIISYFSSSIKYFYFSYFET